MKDLKQILGYVVAATIVCFATLIVLTHVIHPFFLFKINSEITSLISQNEIMMSRIDTLNNSLELARKQLIENKKNLITTIGTNKDILVWNNQTKKVETLDGKMWEIWSLVLRDEICEENFK